MRHTEHRWAEIVLNFSSIFFYVVRIQIDKVFIGESNYVMRKTGLSPQDPHKRW